MSGSCPILVAGLGNLLLSDDGVGVQMVQELARTPWPGVEVLDLGTAVLHALPFLETAERVLVIDAAHGGQPPGTIYLFEADSSSAAQPFSSLHAMGLRAAAAVLNSGRPTPLITVLGIEPASLACGLELTPAVRQALPRALELARATVAGWQQSISPRIPPPRRGVWFGPPDPGGFSSEPETALRGAT